MIVIDNLNMILEDLNLLGISMYNFKGSAWKRFYLILRTYFYEFFRIKEIFNRFIKTLKVNALIDKDSAKLFTNTFYDAFKHAITIRNALVHNDFHWEGRKHIDLILTNVSYELDHIVLDKKSGKFINLQNVIKDISDHYIDILSDEGCRIRNAIQNLINFFGEGVDSFASRLPDRPSN